MIHDSFIIRKGEVGTKFYIVKSGIAICKGDNVIVVKLL